MMSPEEQFTRALDGIFSRQLRDPETMGGMRLHIETAFAHAIVALRAERPSSEELASLKAALRDIEARMRKPGGGYNYTKHDQRILHFADDIARALSSSSQTEGEG